MLLLHLIQNSMGKYHDTLIPEIAQIAGRAGRHSRNGSFGVVEDHLKFDEETIEQIENHSFFL